MAKKTTRKTTSSSDPFNSEVCNLKHEQIEKQFKEQEKRIDDKFGNLKDYIGDNKNETLKAIRGMEEKIGEKMRAMEEQLMSKIKVERDNASEKFDALSEFSDELRGNGEPGVFEMLRSYRRRQVVIITVLVIMSILMIGGEYKGVSLKKIRSFLGLDAVEIKTVETPPNGTKKENDAIITIEEEVPKQEYIEPPLIITPPDPNDP